MDAELVEVSREESTNQRIRLEPASTNAICVDECFNTRFLMCKHPFYSELSWHRLRTCRRCGIQQAAGQTRSGSGAGFASIKAKSHLLCPRAANRFPRNQFPQAMVVDH